MNVLLLGPSRPSFEATLAACGDSWAYEVEPLTVNSSALNGVEFVVSFGYRHIIQQPVLNLFPLRIINIHISLLPWNRGADPNFWAWREGTPHGVTIHHIDVGLDTGPILAQQELKMDCEIETLASSYAKLTETAEALFAKNWQWLRLGENHGTLQEGAGSFHYAREKAELDHLLTEGWKTPVSRIVAFQLRDGVIDRNIA